jgi:hypothetical protein
MDRERRCPGCDDDWPDDEEFYAPGSDLCRACVWERRERLRGQVREAARRYRARRSAAAYASAVSQL